MLIDKSEEGEVKWNYSYSFDLEWVASNCSDCTTSGGYYGYKGAPDNKFQCLCDDRPHSRSLETEWYSQKRVETELYSQKQHFFSSGQATGWWVGYSHSEQLGFNVQVTVPSLASVYNEYALKSQYDTSIYLQKARHGGKYLMFHQICHTEFNSRNIFPSNVKLYVQNDVMAALASGTMGTISYGFTEDGREARAAGVGPVLGDWGR
ncbi:hypothetical protein POM88_050528 [Heracleum sosnowskyi]|uniref:Wall-associated receptor kinase C-terminal domain-containing protein n=1 Tax=Heracleum sosnowskyi TaxID=360622 RepID=A0AAD8M2M7_9APIA|nr:hypothetical protein POM88_050528 [Heracleum sosnowskyi]